MNALEKRTLYRLREWFGRLTIDEALDGALKAEQTKLCLGSGPFDPAWSHFAMRQQRLETMAVLLEKEAAHQSEAP